MRKNEHADAPHALALLRARRARPSGRRATEQRDEVAPFSLDHVVSAQRKCRRDTQPERVRGLEVDHQFVLGRRLNRKFAGFLAPQDTIDVGCRPAPLIDHIEAVGDEAALGCKNSKGIDCWQAVPRRQYVRGGRPRVKR
jgi:hypothetical protein